MKVLIVGGAGFIGSHLVEYHLNLNDYVIVIDNLSTGNKDNIKQHLNKPNFAFYEEDATCADLSDYVSECDLIYAMAAMVGMFNVIKKPVETLRTNTIIIEKLLLAVSQLKNKPPILIASSSEVYGSKVNAISEDTPLVIESTNKAHASYPISKICNEMTAMSYYKEKKVPVIVARIFNTVGPHQSSHYGMVLPRFCQQAINGESITVFDTGEQTRSFCDVRDMSQMLYKLTRTDKSIGEIVNVGNDKRVTIIDLAKLVISATDSKSEIAFQSYNSVFGKEYIIIEHREPNLAKLKTLIDLPTMRPITETIEDILKHLQKEKLDN